MYTAHFNLSKLPFENVPDPVFFFDEGEHARVHHRIKESLKAGRGLMVVAGSIGSGKTTLSQMIISELSNDIKLIWMAEPPSNSETLFLFIAQELGLNPASQDRTFVLRDIRDALQKIRASGSTCLVIIDESHLMTDDTINGIRLLNNLEEGAVKLIQILLLGQEELMKTIQRPDMEAFRQRVATLEVLGKLNAEGVRHYVAHRLHVAGGAPSLLADTGWEALEKATTGGCTPRVINTLCDRALNTAFERKKEQVDVDDVYEAAQEVGLQKEVFFYKIALKQKDKQPPAEAPARTTAAQEEPTPHRVREILPPPLAEEKGFKGPVILLLVSLTALIASILFFCQRAASPDLISCLQEIIGL